MTKFEIKYPRWKQRVEGEKEMKLKDWALMTSVMIIVVLLAVIFTTTPVVEKCEMARPAGASVVPGDGYKTWGEIKHLITEDEEYAR